MSRQKGVAVMRRNVGQNLGPQTVCCFDKVPFKEASTSLRFAIFRTLVEQCGNDEQTVRNMKEWNPRKACSKTARVRGNS